MRFAAFSFAALLLAAAAPLAAAESAAPAAAAPRLAPLPIDDALARARAHLAARPAETGREIVGAQFVPAHGRPGPGFWLIDLAPYSTERPAPAGAFTSLLIAMDGAVEERGGRRPLSAEEQKARDEKAAALHRLSRAAPSP